MCCSDFLNSCDKFVIHRIPPFNYYYNIKIVYVNTIKRKKFKKIIKKMLTTRF
nr:MAG TPA: hypothetical protein [Caudoviricetes sp.]